MANNHINVDDYERDSQNSRYRTIIFIILLVFSLLIIRLADLQLLAGGRYEKMSRSQKLRTIRIRAVRGDIIDRTGKPMALTIQGYQLLLYADPNLKKITDLAGSISELVDVPREDIEKRFQESRHVAGYQPTVLCDNLHWSQVAALEENLTQFNGLEVSNVPKRIYPAGLSASQLVGYLGEVTGKELDPEKNDRYLPGDIVGRMGIEQAYEHVLRGEDGSQKVVVDSTGRRNELFEEELNLPKPTPATPGKTVELTIDLDFQRACEEILGDTAGAAVVMNVHTGEILAMASTPGFDPNLMMGKLDPEEWKKWVEDERRPFFYRPLQGEYPPGSVFKVMVGAAALEKRVIHTSELIECRGWVELGANKDKYHCWNHNGHGYVDFYNSLVQSCDVYYYRLGELLGIDTINKYAEAFGLGYAPGLGLPGEKSGLVPNPLWKRRYIGKSWYLGDTVITAIGQGYTLLSPLQVTRMMSVIANGGKLMKPLIVRRILDKDGNVIEDFIPTVEIPKVVSPETCRTITSALIGVVHDGRGTAHNRMEDLKTRVAGKTGTAQVISRSRKKIFMSEEGEIPWKYRDHAWFTAFAPANNPKIAVTVLIEHGGSGSVAAAPICGRIINYYVDNMRRLARN